MKYIANKIMANYWKKFFVASEKFRILDGKKKGGIFMVLASHQYATSKFLYIA